MSKGKFNIDRKAVIERAYDECMVEMYAKAQPSADYKELVSKKKSGEIIDTDLDPIYRRYYLSQEEFKYIRDKYIKAYNLTAHWYDDMDVAIEYLRDGGLTTVSKKDSSGNSYRTSEKTPKLKDVIGEEYAEEVLKLLTQCKDFYRFDREETDFSCVLSLGCSPTSNKETVIQYWKEHGQDITIEERNPETFWYRDAYGDGWKEVYEWEMEEAKRWEEEEKEEAKEFAEKWNKIKEEEEKKRLE